MTYDDAKDFAYAALPKWEPPKFKHTCHSPPGTLRILFQWRWPFVYIWRSRSICLCDINAILDEIGAAQ